MDPLSFPLVVLGHPVSLWWLLESPAMIVLGVFGILALRVFIWAFFK
jgi:hypothetical protein